MARQVTARDQKARVFGVTSRGIFLWVDSGWVLFLSRESYRGPLTLNLAGEPGRLETMESGDPCDIVDSSLHFPKNRLRLSLMDTAEWQPAPPPRLVIDREAIHSRVEAVGRQILDGPLVFAADVISELREGMRSGQAEIIPQLVESLLGQGTGLTPSGDDLAMGLLLALNRWRKHFPPDLPVEEINRRITQSAADKTTTLSANLVACAAQGLADERIILALDGLVTATPDIPTCAALLRGWGQHSGCDAFIGISIALEGLHR